MQVLVVDDDRAIRETMRLALEEEGYVVSEAPDGAVALKLLRGGTEARVVLLDLRMPRVTGLEVLQQAAEEPEIVMRNAFVLVTANLHTLDTRAKALLAGLAVPTVAKPFELDDLLAIVAQAAHRVEPPGHGGPFSAHPLS